jgi:hypothetical protein
LYSPRNDDYYYLLHENRQLEHQVSSLQTQVAVLERDMDGVMLLASISQPSFSSLVQGVDNYSRNYLFNTSLLGLNTSIKPTPTLPSIDFSAFKFCQYTLETCLNFAEVGILCRYHDEQLKKLAESLKVCEFSECTNLAFTGRYCENHIWMEI